MGDVIEVDFSRNKNKAAGEEDEENATLELIKQLSDSSESPGEYIHKVFSHFLDKGKVMVHFLVDHPDVDVPKTFRDQNSLALNFHHAYNAPPMEEMIDDEGVAATLKFGARQYRCYVPWGAAAMFYAHDTEEGFVLDPQRFEEVMRDR